LKFQVLLYPPAVETRTVSRPVASQIFGVGHFYEIVDPDQAQSQTSTEGGL